MTRALRLLALFVLTTVPVLAGTVRNDDSCDLAALPAATLLLPYFEVDLDVEDKDAYTTLFTIVNVSASPQIANVTLWSDWAYPLLSFDLFLTGYDVQAINLRDVLVRGTLASPAMAGMQRGSRSQETNPNFLDGVTAACANVPAVLSAHAREDLRAALTTGTTSGCPGAAIGGVHERATGYATVDVVATCSSALPTDPEYFDELLYDNVLTGDYELVSPNRQRGNYAGGSPMVHIRAIPEGGKAGRVEATNLPYTFYDRMFGSAESRRRSDRRQPLPSAFIARYFQGANSFLTDLLIWREGTVAAGALCDAYGANKSVALQPLVRFDERENPTFEAGVTRTTAATSRLSTQSSFFPPLVSGDIGGWIYLNLNHTTNASRQSQSWVVVNLSSEGRFSVARDAVMLANGCSPEVRAMRDFALIPVLQD